MVDNTQVEIWKLKVKAFAIATVGTMISVALWQGHNGVALAAGVGAVVSIAGVKIANSVISKVKGG